MRRDEIKAAYELGLDAVVDLVERLFSIIEAQQLELEAVKAQVKELQDRLTTSSRNSGKPLSSDNFRKQTRSLRQKSGKKTGGQPGHQGSRLALRDKPDLVVMHQAQVCCACGSSLTERPGEMLPERRQLYDLPPLKLHVTEHRLSRDRCLHCGQENVAEFPAGVPRGASYGGRLKAWLVYLHKAQLIPVARSCQIVEDLFAHTISEGTLHTMICAAAPELEEAHAAIKGAVIKAGVVNFDETGMGVAEQRGWLHTASTKSLTYYAYDRKRGREASERIGILPEFRHVACHDALSSYLSYECLHSLCNAHHLRELIFLEEVQRRAWAGEMKRLLLEIKSRVAKARAQGQDELSPTVQARLAHSYEDILQRGRRREAKEPPLPTGKRGRKKQSKAKNLLDRLRKYQEETLRFMREFQVPFDNNLAARDLRMMKVQQKVSGCFRTEEGAEDFCRIRSYISTMKKQGHNVLEALRSVFTGNPLMPDTG